MSAPLRHVHGVPPPGDWHRTVCVPLERPGFHVQTSERLDVDAAAERLMEAIRERGDAGVRNWLDHALNGTLGDLTPTPHDFGDAA